MFSQRNKNLSTWRHKAVLLILVIVSSLVINIATPRPAQAQWTTFDIPRIASNVWTQVKAAATWAYERGSAIAFRNAIKTFTQQLAYNAAVQLSSGGEGQTPLFSMQSIGEAAKIAGDAALGDALDSLISDPKSGFGRFNVCEPTGPNAPYIRLMISTALFNEYDNKPREPKCSLSKLKENWDKVINDPKYRKDFTKNFAPQLDPSQNNLGTTLSIQQNILKERDQKAQDERDEQKKNQGYLPITETITGFIKTPAPTLKNVQDVSWQQIAAEPLVYTTDIVADALGVFTNTFAARMMKKLQQGVVPSPSRLMSSKFGSNVGPIGGVEYAIQTNISISTPDVKGGEKIDVISDFSNCPEDVTFAPVNNCTIDSSFARALRQADEGNPLTVQEAIDQDLIRGDWNFKDIRSLVDSPKPDAWYVSDLKKLRKARIIPIGWELAAEKAMANGSTLQEVIGRKDNNYATGFNGVGNDGVCGTGDANESVYCGLIDPNWVLRAPPSQCRLQAYGQQLEFEGSNRQKTCVDVQNCVAEKADGSCQAWGYCTREKNIWRMNGDSCEFPENSGYSPYASCQAYTNTYTGSTVAYLKDYLQGFSNGICDAGNASCRWYSTSFNVSAVADAVDRYKEGGSQTDVNTTDIKLADASALSRLYLKKVAEDFSCSNTAEGCHKFFRLNNIDVKNIPVAERIGSNTLEQVVNYVARADISATYDSFASPTKTEPGVKALSLREAPAYLNCYGGGVPSAECNNYLAACTPDEVGCDLYTPTDGSPTLPAISDPTNVCPAECIGYNTYRQIPSDFQLMSYKGTPPVITYDGTETSFIPTRAQKCSVQEVGCEEFTNIEAGERREYFSYLRQCVKPGNGEHTYYTWVGSDVTGYQLKTWELKATGTNPTDPPATTDDSGELGLCGDAGQSDFQNPNSVTSLDCKQFYDSTGGVHYRYASRTITASEACVKYRKTIDADDNAQLENCEASGGEWQDNVCFYQAIPSEGKSCNVQSVGCREYRGPTAENVKILFTSTFGSSGSPDTSAAEGWSGGVSSPESDVFGGRSYQDGDNDGLIEKSVTGKLIKSSQYIVQLWAKQGGSSGNLSVTLKPSSAAGVSLAIKNSSPQVGADWKLYEFGPAQVEFDVSGQLVLQISGPGGFYIDSVVLKQIQDTFFLRKNTWVMPKDAEGNNICTDSYLGCRAYSNKSKETVARTGFARLCREKAVGCEALVDTRNTTSPKAQNIDMGDGRTIAIPADQVVYRVYDTKKQCAEEDIACTRVGEPVFSSSGAITKWSDKFVRLNPEGDKGFIAADGKWNSSSVMCRSTEDRCTEFKDDKNSSYFFKDPGDQVCEYKKVDALNGYKWYKKGTTELCNLASNPSFENFSSITGVINSGARDDGIEDAFPSWRPNTDSTKLYAVSAPGSLGSTVVKVVTSNQQYSGIASDDIDVGPAQANPRYFTLTAKIFVPDIAANNNMTSWLLIPHATPPGGCAPRTVAGPVTCSHFDFMPGFGFGDQVTVADKGKWVFKQMSIKVDPGVTRLVGLIFTNHAAVGNTPNQVVYIDQFSVTESQAPLSYICPREQSGCTEFREPGLTKQSYYYLKNGKLGSDEKCTGVSETQGCLLFNDTSNSSLAWSSATTYANSRSKNNALVPPASAGTTDTNIIMKVRRDRVCGEWLSCMSESTRFIGKSPRNICYALGRCDRWGSEETGKCGNWLTPSATPQVLNESVYRERRTGGADATKFDWGDKEYSGYSIPGIYPIDVLGQKNYATEGAPADIRLTYINSSREDMGIDGTKKEQFKKICRIYPEADSPFPGEGGTVRTWKNSCIDTNGDKCSTGIIVELPEGKEMDYKDANACQKGENCECLYQRVSYTQGETLFYGFESNNWKPVFAVDEDTNTPPKAINTKLKKRDYLIGSRGYCLEQDQSRLINAGDATSRACLTWLPIDTVAGDISIYDFNPEAGFQSSAYYCSAATGYNLINDNQTTSNLFQPISGVGTSFITKSILPDSTVKGPNIHTFTSSSGDVNWPSGGANGENIMFSDANMKSGFYKITGKMDNDLSISFGLSDALRVMGGKSAIAAIRVKGIYSKGGFNNCFMAYGDLCNYEILTRNQPSVFREKKGSSDAPCAGQEGASCALSINVNWKTDKDIPYSKTEDPINGITDAQSDAYINNFIQIHFSDGLSGVFDYGFVVEFIPYNSCQEVVQVSDGTNSKAFTDNLLRRTDLQVALYDDAGKTGLGFTSTRRPNYYGYMPLPPTRSMIVTNDPNRIGLADGGGDNAISYDSTGTPYSCTTFGCSPTEANKVGLCVRGFNIGKTCKFATDCDEKPAEPKDGICSGYFSGVCMEGATPKVGTSCIMDQDCGTGGSCGNYRSLAKTVDGIKAITEQLFAKVNFKYNWNGAVSSWSSVNPGIDKSGDINLGAKPPVIKQVKFDNTSKSPQEGDTGFTIVTSSGSFNTGKCSNSGSVCTKNSDCGGGECSVGVKSPAAVSTIFYAYNPNGQQMPLTDVYVDWGDGTQPSGGNGKYKNHKHMCGRKPYCSLAVPNASFEKLTGPPATTIIPDDWWAWELNTGPTPDLVSPKFYTRPLFAKYDPKYMHAGNTSMFVTEGEPIADPSSPGGWRDAASILGTNVGRLKKGVTYKATAWFKTWQLAGNPAGALYLGDNEWREGLNNNFVSVALTANGQWQQLEAVFTPVRDADFTLDLYVRSGDRVGANNPTKNWLVYDDVALEVVNQSCAEGGPECASTVVSGITSTCVAPPFTFGDTPQACVQDGPSTEGYFTFTHVYANPSNTPYTPKVFVKDNWDWCTGADGTGKHEINDNSCKGFTAVPPAQSGAFVSPISITVKP